jgi:CBS-domain-containing membrane protein
MEPIKNSGALTNGVPASAKLEQIAPRVVNESGPVPVMDDEGAPIGMLSREHLLHVLFKDPASRARG